MGGKTVDFGRQIAWSSPTTDDSDVVLLPETLAPGEEVKLADVLSDDPAARRAVRRRLRLIDMRRRPLSPACA